VDDAWARSSQAKAGRPLFKRFGNCQARPAQLGITRPPTRARRVLLPTTFIPVIRAISPANDFLGTLCMGRHSCPTHLLLMTLVTSAGISLGLCVMSHSATVCMRLPDFRCGFRFRWRGPGSRDTGRGIKSCGLTGHNLDWHRVCLLYPGFVLFTALVWQMRFRNQEADGPRWKRTTLTFFNSIRKISCKPWLLA
jgi:hypothetical protein